MGNTERVEIVESSGNLMSDGLGSAFRNAEFSLFEISEEIASGEVLHNDINIVLVFEDIQESDDIGMLTHLQNFNFSSLELYI